MIVRDFQKIIGKEIKEQLMEKQGRLPNAVIACVGGGSNAMGAFYEFLPHKEVRLIGCFAANKPHLFMGKKLIKAPMALSLLLHRQ